MRYQLAKAQECMQNHANQHRRDVSFTVGDFVYLKLQPYRQTTVAFRSNLKLSPRFYGPYEIVEKIGPVAYRLAFPKGSLIHNVFHVSKLRKHIGHVQSISSQLPPISEEATVLPQPEAVLAHREVQKGKYRPKLEVLIKWKGAPVEDATWENAWQLRKAFPSFILEDKDVLGEGN